jgi:uncharacterized lipoprotein
MHRRDRGFTAVALLVGLVVALLAGCGGSSGSSHQTPSYTKQVNAVANSLNSVTNDLYTPTDLSSAADELTTVEAALRKAASQLAAITPPPAIKADHERLVEAMHELASGVSPLIAKLKSGNIEDVSAAFSLKAARNVRTAIEAINHAGYKIDFPLLG